VRNLIESSTNEEMMDQLISASKISKTYLDSMQHPQPGLRICTFPKTKQ